LHGRGKQCHPVPVPLPAAHDDLVRREVEVVDSQPKRLEQAQRGTIEEYGDQPLGAVQREQNGANVVPGKDDGKLPGSGGPDEASKPRQVDAEDRPVEEKQRRQRLVLGGPSYPIRYG
jgi:hypothetical protein